MSIRACVTRNFDGWNQFIPIEDALVVPGEDIFLGIFEDDVLHEGVGPSKSNKPKICLPQGQPRSYPITCCTMAAVAPNRDWVGVSGPIVNSNNERLFIPRRLHLELSGAS